jgi:glutathionyl-hydroquinone reductase
MGLLVNGQWRDQWYDTASSGGRFLRKESAYRSAIFGIMENARGVRCRIAREPLAIRRAWNWH